MFSKACEYGIRAMTQIALHSKIGNRIGLKAIAKSIGSPEAFTAKILQQLSRNNLVDSVKGPAGGFEMNAKQLRNITLSDIVKTIDGDLVYTGCGLGLKNCSELSPCPLHQEFKAIREQLKNMLETTSVEKLANSLANGETVLKN